MLRWLLSLFTSNPNSRMGAMAEMVRKASHGAMSAEALELVKDLASTIRASTEQAFGSGAASWTSAALNIRFPANDVGSVEKIQVQKPDGAVSPLQVSYESMQQVLALDKLRSDGGNFWDAVLITVHVEGSFSMEVEHASKPADGVSLKTSF